MKILKKIFQVIVKIINHCVPVDSRSLYFIPHPNCRTDKYDIINYSSDNVLVLLNYLLKKDSAEYYKIYVEIYDSSRISEYQEYIYGINPNIRCTFLCACVGRFFFNKVSFKDMLYAFFCFCRASKCFTATFYYDFSFKKRSQQIICLGYYTPFKDDYHMGDHSYDKFRNTTCNSFDYSIATSCLSARIISIDCGISYDKFKVLGFPRNDLLISKNNCNVIKREISKFAGYDVTKYIVYTPTFRDYETVTEGNLRSILGYVDCDLLKLSKILLKFNAALILKLHPLQNKTVLKKDLPKGILVFEQTYKYGLYDLLSFSDGMITDYTSTSWIKPGKAFRVCRLDMKTCMEGVDFCVDRGLQYIELDAGWYGPEMKMSSSALKVLETRDIDMPKLCQYAKSKGIGVWVYVNQRALYQELDQLLPLYEKWGISGIKFGFVQIGSQEWTTWLHNAVKKCADHHIMVDIHDEYRPTGWSRTYPNLMTQEGIGGNEEMPDAEHNTILPFTRFLCGPADYTPCYFNGRVKNTKAHQLAMPVVYYSPITFLYWYDLPNVYKGEKELDFWKYCPTVWDESKALQGEIGEYIVQARRSGNDWFVGAMTGLQARDITLNTADFLQKGKKYRVEIYNDDPKLNTRTKVSTVVQTIKAGKILKLHLQPSGGAALRFSLLK